MDPVSFGVSILSLASLFQTCLDCFDLVERGSNFAHDYAILIARLDAQKEILSIWGEVVGLGVMSQPAVKDRLLRKETRDRIEAHLKCIQMIFEDASKLTKHYGLTMVEEQSTLSRLKFRRTSKQIAEQKPSTFTTRLLWFQRNASMSQKAKWAIRDGAKFKTMLETLKDLICDLKDITSSIADIERQREIFAQQVAMVESPDDLEIIEQALLEEDSTLSEVASQRLISLTEVTTTARSVTSYYTGQTRIVADDDMETHADSDPDAQELGNDDETVTSAIESLSLTETSFGISAEGGHQDNLSHIQVADRLQSQYLDWEDPENVQNNWTFKRNIKYATRIMREIKIANRGDTPCISITPMRSTKGEYHLDQLLGSFQGPPNTPYEGGVFHVHFSLPKDYPFVAPHCRILTPIYHPQIDSKGNVSLHLNSHTSAVYLEHWLLMLASLLASPDFEYPLVPEIAAQALHDKVAFEVNARLYTQKYAHREPPAYDLFNNPPESAAYEIRDGMLKQVQSLPNEEEACLSDKRRGILKKIFGWAMNR